MSAVSTHLEESSVVNAPLSKVWDIVSANTFTWWNLVGASELVSGATAQTLDATVKLTFKDGQVWFIGIREMSSIHHTVTFELISAEPVATFSASIHTISLRRISQNDTTYVHWETNFSSDVSAEVVVDSSFKRKEAFADLAAACV